jgi:hypothetical protein
MGSQSEMANAKRKMAGTSPAIVNSWNQFVEARVNCSAA